MNPLCNATLPVALAFTVPDVATSFIKFKIKSDTVAKRTLKLVISRFCSV